LVLGKTYVLELYVCVRRRKGKGERRRERNQLLVGGVS
jgi:hypothetical protein